MRKVLLALSLLVMLGVLGLFGLKFYVETQVAKSIEDYNVKLAGGGQVTYGSIKADPISRSLIIRDLSAINGVEGFDEITIAEVTLVPKNLLDWQAPLELIKAENFYGKGGQLQSLIVADFSLQGVDTKALAEVDLLKNLRLEKISVGKTEAEVSTSIPGVSNSLTNAYSWERLSGSHIYKGTAETLRIEEILNTSKIDLGEGGILKSENRTEFIEVQGMPLSSLGAYSSPPQTLEDFKALILPLLEEPMLWRFVMGPMTLNQSLVTGEEVQQVSSTAVGTSEMMWRNDEATTSLTLSMEGLSVPLPAQHPNAAMAIDAGLDKIALDYDMAMTLDRASGALTLERMALDFDKMAKVTLEAKLESVAIDPASPFLVAVAQDRPVIDGFSLTLEDQGMVSLVEQLQQSQGKTLLDAKRQAVQQLQGLVNLKILDIELAKQLAEFIKDPRKITLSVQMKQKFSLFLLPQVLLQLFAPNSQLTDTVITVNAEG